MLRGSAPARIDEKGRLKLPAVFRSTLEPQYGTEFFVTSLWGESVRIYPMEVWKRIEERLASGPRFEPARMRFRNAVNYYGQPAVMDPQGRILIHPLLRECASVAGDVTVVGLHDYLEVWNRAACVERLEKDPLTPEDLERLGI